MRHRAEPRKLYWGFSSTELLRKAFKCLPLIVVATLLANVLISRFGSTVDRSSASVENHVSKDDSRPMKPGVRNDFDIVRSDMNLGERQEIAAEGRRSTQVMPERQTSVMEENSSTQSVGQLLQQWRGAILTNDADSEAALFAPAVIRFFQKADTTPDWIRQYMRSEYLAGLHNNSSTMEQITVSQLAEDKAEATFVQELQWTRHGQEKTFKNRVVMHLVRIAGEWKISSIRAFNIT